MYIGKESSEILISHRSICPGICRLLWLAWSTHSVVVSVQCIVIPILFNCSIKKHQQNSYLATELDAENLCFGLSFYGRKCLCRDKSSAI